MNNTEKNNLMSNLPEYLFDIISLLKVNNTIYEEDFKIVCKIIYENSQNKNQIIEGLILYIMSLINESTEILYDKPKNIICCDCHPEEDEVEDDNNPSYERDDDYNHFQQEEPYMEEALNKLRIFLTDRGRRLVPEEILEK